MSGGRRHPLEELHSAEPTDPPIRGWQWGERGTGVPGHQLHPPSQSYASSCVFSGPRSSQIQGRPVPGRLVGPQIHQVPVTATFSSAAHEFPCSKGTSRLCQGPEALLQMGLGPAHPTTPSQMNRLEHKAGGQTAPHQVQSLLLTSWSVLAAPSSFQARDAQQRLSADQGLLSQG